MVLEFVGQKEYGPITNYVQVYSEGEKFEVRKMGPEGPIVEVFQVRSTKWVTLDEFKKMVGGK